MSRYIDADALAKFIDYGHLNNPDEKLYSENDIREMIDMMPTVDAVPVIRCKDCKYWTRNDGMFKDFDEREWHHCPHLGIDTDGYFSCIEGERKEE